MAISLLDGSKQIEIKDCDLVDVDGAPIANGDPETSYTVRQIPPEVSRRLAKQHTTHPINRKTGRRDEEIDREQLIDDLLDYAVIGWSGIVLNGVPVACSTEHKLLLDFQRKGALLRVAGMNQSQQTVDAREESFRSTAKLV